MLKNSKRSVVFCLVMLLVLSSGINVFAREFTVTPGVEYSKGPTTWNSRAQSIHTVTVDVGRPEISIEAMIPSPLKSTKPLTQVLQNHSTNGHHVVAGINASFFHMNSGAPAYLLAANNIVNTYGVISTGNDEYMSIPSAFAIDKDGKGKIGKFDYEASVITPDGPKKIDSINKSRETAEVVLYTDTYSYLSTRTNEYGMEIVLSNLSSSIEENYILGTPVTAKVEKVVPYGSGGSIIPLNGAVLSIQGGTLAAEFANIQVGSELTLSVDLTDPWKDAEFVLASGPLLVQNGIVDMTIDPRSRRATTREPRTAVAVNADGTKVFLVTVDGRHTNSAGMTLTEFSEYLVSLGAHAALNLDGGGSTTVAVRERGTVYPKVFNAPSQGTQRYVSAILGAVSKTETGVARTIDAKLSSPSILLKGATTSVQLNLAMDVNFHVVPILQDEVQYEVTGDIGTISSTGEFTSTKAGKGSISVSYGNATQTFPIEVLDAPATIAVTGDSSGEVGPNDHVKFDMKAYDPAGREMFVPPALVSWEASTSLGTIDSTGLLLTNNEGEGSITATIGTKSVSIPVQIVNGGKVVHSFENSTEWIEDSARAATSIRFDGSKAPYKEGETGLTLSYDFTEHTSGTSASYAVLKNPLSIGPKPTALGLWVFGDGAAHWLRGTIIDRNGNDVTIDFTAENGLNWKGWKYVKANIPASVQGPIKVKRIYIAETSSQKKNKGSIYLDKLIAEYGNAYQEDPFNDVSLNYWAIDEINNAVAQGWINGYTDGKFKPENSLSREHAALLLSRVLNLKLEPVTEDVFTDVSVSHQYAREIAAIKNLQIISGKGDGSFDPSGALTRAQMAKILVNTFSLTLGDAKVPPLSDVGPNFWALEDIKILQANGVTVVSDGKYRPNEFVKRTQFAVFLTRAHQ